MLEFSYPKCTIWVVTFLKEGLPSQGKSPPLVCFFTLSTNPFLELQKKKLREETLIFHSIPFDSSLQIKFSYKNIKMAKLAGFKCRISVKWYQQEISNTMNTYTVLSLGLENLLQRTTHQHLKIQEEILHVSNTYKCWFRCEGGLESLKFKLTWRIQLKDKPVLPSQEEKRERLGLTTWAPEFPRTYC